MPSKRAPEEYRRGLWSLALAFTLLGAGHALSGLPSALAWVTGVGGLALAAALWRSRLLGAASVAAGVFGLLEAVPGAGLDYRTALVLEALAAGLPLAALALTRWAGHRARRALGARRVPLALAALLAAGLATAIRVGEIALLWDRPGTLATVRYILRGDLAETFWALAAFATAGAYLYAAHAAGASRPTFRRAATGALAALLLFSFVGYDVGTAAAAAAHGPIGMGVGLHADSLRALPAGIRLAHLEVSWDRVERRLGERDWTAYDEEVAEAERRGVQLYLLANTYPPAWLARMRPESVMVDQDGEPFTWIDEKPGTPRERVWDLSFHDPVVLDLKADFAQAVAARYAGSPAVRWISVQNEPAYPVDWNLVRYASYDNATVEAFRDHLRQRLRTLEAVNENASRAWTSWEEVQAPTHPFAGLWGEWMRFREDALLALVERLTGAVRPVAEGKPVTVKIMAHGLTRFAEPQAGLSDRVVRGFANLSDVVSVDLYPATLDDLRRSLDYYEHLAAGKPLVVAEFNLLLGTNLPTGGARLVNALLAMDGRVEAVFLFTAEDHWLYSMTAHARSPGLTALALVTQPALSQGFPLALSVLLVEDTLALQNVYHVYAMGMVAAGLPVLPWPLVLLVSAPVPVESERTRWWIALLKLGLLVAALLVLGL